LLDALRDLYAEVKYFYTKPVAQTQKCLNILPSEKTIAGVSRDSIMAHELSVFYDGEAGRVLAFFGRYASLMDKKSESSKARWLHEEPLNLLSLESI